MTRKSHGNALSKGYQILWYRIVGVLGHGGFGITYEAMDTNLEKTVAIKEYLPVEYAVREENTTVRPFTEDRKEMFEWGLDRFLQEARTLAKLQHPNIVLVHNVFEQNGTAYMAMHYEQGESLYNLYRRGGMNSEADLMRIAIPLIDGLEHIHDTGFIHRDVKPANINIRLDGTPVLLDFGSARFAIGGETKTLTSLVSPGYAPYEQYNAETGKQGPWTDIYGLAATLYAGINHGRGPLDAIVRGHARIEGKPDPLQPAMEIGKGLYSEALLKAIDAGLGFTPDERPQTMEEWRLMFPDLGAQPTIAHKRQKPPPSNEADIPTLIHGEGSMSAPSKQKRVHWWLLAAAVIAVVVAGLVMLLPDQRPSGDPQAQQLEQTQKRLVEQAVQQALQAEQDRHQAEQQAEFDRKTELKQALVEQEQRLAEQFADEQLRLENQRQQLALQQQQQTINKLLAEGDRALETSRLSSPAGDNAMEYYQSVLKLDASNIPAKKGIGKIVTRYLELARNAAVKNDWGNANRYISNAGHIDPDGDSVLNARKQITQLRNEAERKLKLQQELEQKRIEEEKATLASKLPFALVTWGETKKRSVDYVSDKLKLVFMKAITDKSTYDQNELVISEVDVGFFSEKYSHHKSVAICSENHVSIIVGAYFDHGMGGRTGDLVLASFDCKTKNYTKKAYPVEFHSLISKWGPSWRKAMKRFLDDTAVFNKPN
jgi:serine/threonine protein kinase